MEAGAGADVDDVVGGADGVFVVLDDDDGVADVGEVSEGSDEAVVVALVEADGGLVEDVAGSDESGADLGGESDALGLAAGEGSGGAVEGEVLESDGPHEAEPGLDFLEDGLGDGGALGGELEAVEDDRGAFDGEAGEVVDGEEADAGGDVAGVLEVFLGEAEVVGEVGVVAVVFACCS